MYEKTKNKKTFKKFFYEMAEEKFKSEWEIRMDTIIKVGVPDEKEKQDEIVEMLFPSFQAIFENAKSYPNRFEISNSILFVNGNIQKMYVEDPYDVTD